MALKTEEPKPENDLNDMFREDFKTDEPNPEDDLDDIRRNAQHGFMMSMMNIREEETEIIQKLNQDMQDKVIKKTHNLFLCLTMTKHLVLILYHQITCSPH